MLEFKVLVSKLLSVDTFATTPVTGCILQLVHESMSNMSECAKCIITNDADIHLSNFGTVPLFYLPVSKVSSLQHKVGNHTVKDGSLIMKGLSSLPDPLFTSAESAKVLGSLGHNITEQTKDDASTFASIDINVEVDFICDLWVLAVVCT